MVGESKMVYIPSLSVATGCTVLAKVEFLGFGGTSKDRIAAQIVSDAEASGALRPGGVIVEGTSGSTGISLAFVARARGYRCRIYMPDDQALEKSELLVKLGAEVERVKPVAIANPRHYVNLAREYAASHPDAFYANQFESESNFKCHLEGTGPEILAQCAAAGLPVDAFVMGAGTGGTIAGVSVALKTARPSTRVYLADPNGSSLLHYVKHGVCFAEQQREQALRRNRYDTVVEGVGLDRVTANFRRALVDDAFRCTDQEVVDMSRYLLQHEGMFVGSSSAMHVVGAVKAARALGPGHTIVTVLCDSGARHVTRFWSDDFLRTRGLQPPAPSFSTSPMDLTFVR